MGGFFFFPKNKKCVFVFLGYFFFLAAGWANRDASIPRKLSFRVKKGTKIKTK